MGASVIVTGLSPEIAQTLVTLGVDRNITAYAARGEVLIDVVDAGVRRGVRVVARDHGPGIENLERALTDGYTTGGGLGLGLPGAWRLVDELDIQTAPGQGTRVTLVKWTRPSGRVPDALDRGQAGAAMPGASRSGDVAVFAPTPT
jgi:serine/threonine-protein kinase RsbT